ncbi:MAG TPA: flagellar motor switch protein FliM [Bacillota bacterium]|nr:flagellar motor switch protein FliM [Bacillota bacterium]
MSDILSQSEIDSLLAALSDGPVAKEDKGSSGGSKAKGKNKDDRHSTIKVYDFRRPSKFSKEQLHTIQAIHENFSRLVATYLAAHVRTVVQVNVTSVEQLTYEEVVNSIPNPTIMSIITAHPLEGNIILDLKPSMAFTIIDRMFGGPGDAPDKVRGLTDIERSVIERIVNGMLEHFAEAWENIVQLEPKLELVESNPQFAQVVSPSEMVVMVTLEMKIGDKTGIMTICIPYIVIEPVVNKLNAHFWYSGLRKKNTTDHLEVLRHNIEKARIPMSVILGHADLTVGELLDLQIGDVVQLDSPVGRPLGIVVGSKIKFEGTAGLVGSKMGIQITCVVKEGDDQNE